MKKQCTALSKAVNEVKLIIQLLWSMKILVKLPMIVCMDNVGSIFMAGDVTAMSQTKQVTTGTSMSMNILKME